MEHFRGQGWSITGSTGTMAAALAQNSVVFALKASAIDATKPNRLAPAPLEIERLELIYTSIVASGSPLLAGRGLALFRGTNDANGKTMPSGGSVLTGVFKRRGDQGADSGIAECRISTTGTLTAGQFTRDTTPLATLDLVAGGLAGARLILECSKETNGESIWLEPGEILVVSNAGAAFDALLTWQLTVNIDYRRRDIL